VNNHYKVIRVIYCAVIILLTASLVRAKEIRVPEDYPSIQIAVEKAQSKDTIIIDDGSYNENILIDKPLVLRSLNGRDAVRITAKEVNKAVITVLETDNVTIFGITATDSENSGILLRRSNNCVITDNKATNNYRGIYLEYSNNNTLSGNLSTNNVIGLTLGYSDGNQLKENNVDSNVEQGVILLSSNKNILINNTANSNYWNGFTLWSSNENRLERNSVLNNTYAIVISASENNILLHNRSMRRLFYLLPVALIYIGVLFYFLERKLFVVLYGK